MSVKLTDAQVAMLSAAAQRDDFCLASPDKMKGAILAKVSERLVKLGPVREVRAKAKMPVWRRDGAGQSYALKLTAAALNAIAVDEGSEVAIATSKATRPQPLPNPDATNAPDPVTIVAKTLTPRAGSKLTRVIDLLRRSDGATILQLTEAYAVSRRERKKVEMLFAHLKRILGLGKLRLRGPSGAKDEFLLAATAQICGNWRSSSRSRRQSSPREAGRPGFATVSRASYPAPPAQDGFFIRIRPIATFTVAIRNARSTSIREIHSFLTNVRKSKPDFEVACLPVEQWSGASGCGALG
jgi:hypothetical protein